MLDLTKRTEQIICRLFSKRDRQYVIELLELECADNLPLLKDPTPEKMERLRFAALKTSEGDLLKLNKSVELAKKDWRDLLVCAAFATDVNAHELWGIEILGSGDSI